MNREVEIFVSTIGQDIFKKCMSALENQKEQYRIRVIENIQPMNEAFNVMIQQASREYFIQVDEDMVIHPNGIRRLCNAIKEAKSDVICVCLDLFDVDLDKQIQGVKIYRTKLMKAFRFENRVDCEMDMIRKWEESGLKINIINEVVGTHEPCFDTKSTFMRYKQLAEKELYGFEVMTGWLKDMMERWRKNPTDLKRLFAVLGAISGYSSSPVAANKERGIYDYHSLVYKRFFEYFKNGKRDVNMKDLFEPMVSVILPVYKKKIGYLQQAIDSILKQSFSDFELILITNGCPKDICNEMQKYAGRDKRIKILNMKEANLVKALNYGIKYARGRYIARQDGDDLSDPDRFMIQVDYLEKHSDISFVGSTAKLIDSEGIFLRICPQKQGMVKIKKLLEYNNAFTHGSIMIRTDILKKNHYSESPKHLHIEDFELWRRLIAQGHKADNLALPLYTYRCADGVCRTPEQAAIQNHNRQELIKIKAINKTYAAEDLDEYSDYVRILLEIKEQCEDNDIIFNIDGLDNSEKWKPRFWEYSHAVNSSKVKRGETVLDAGSGFSIFPALLAKVGCRVHSLDVNYQGERLHMAAKLGLDIQADKGTFFKLPYPDGYFDKVFCISCIEHLRDFEDVKKTMSEFRRVLKYGGVLFLTVDYHKDYVDYGKANWKWSANTRFYNWQEIADKIIHPSKMELVGNSELYDSTNWEAPPLYGNYTFASVLLRKD